MKHFQIKTWMLGLVCTIGASGVSTSALATTPARAPSASAAAAGSAPGSWWPTSTPDGASSDFNKDINLLDSIEFSFGKEIEIPKFQSYVILKLPTEGNPIKNYCQFNITRENPSSKGIIEAGRPSVKSEINNSRLTSYGSQSWDSNSDMASLKINAWSLPVSDPRGKITALACYFTEQTTSNAIKFIANVLKANGVSLKATYKEEEVEKVARPTEDFIAVNPDSVQSAH